MNNTESTGESSCNGREDGDGTAASERPHKKARYAWQVKGKYHLKNETDESNTSHTPPAAAASNESSPKSQNSNIRVIELDNYFKNELESDKDRSLLTPSNVVKEQQTYPRYISSYERKSESSMNKSFHNETVPSKDYDVEDEDICIRQWQAQQMLKIFLDNTLNRAMETWTRSLPEDDENPGILAFDFAQFFNHFPGDNSVENEGIMMAISAHGLQNTSNNNSDDASSIENNNSDSSNATLGSLSPTLSLEDEQQQNSIEPVEYDSFISREEVPSAYYSEPYDIFSNSNQNSDLDMEDGNNIDFMNAAIIHAIKTNGLTIPGTEYG